MTVSFNRVILAGIVVRDPVIRYTPQHKAVTEVVLAINDTRLGPGGKVIEEKAYVSVTLWEKLAEVAEEYLSKGSPVLIEGRLKYDTWEKDGKRHAKLFAVGHRVQLLEQGKRAGDHSDGRDAE